MNLIEPHIHMMSRTTDDYSAMALAGIVACVEPSFWPGTDRSAVDCFRDYWEHLIGFEAERAAKYGLKHYSMIGVNPKEARGEIAPLAVEAMEPYLDRPGVVGIGEIGLDLITYGEEEIFRRQLRLAEKYRLPIIIHSPHQNKKKGVERIIAILEEENATRERIVIDHNTEETIEMSLASKCWAGMTVYYVTKLSAERAVRMIVRYGTERMIVNGSADWGHSDPLAVARVALELKRDGSLSPDEVRKVVYGNPFQFFRQSPKFDLGDF